MDRVCVWLCWAKAPNPLCCYASLAWQPHTPPHVTTPVDTLVNTGKSELRNEQCIPGKIFVRCGHPSVIWIISDIAMHIIIRPEQR